MNQTFTDSHLEKQQQLIWKKRKDNKPLRREAIVSPRPLSSTDTNFSTLITRWLRGCVFVWARRNLLWWVEPLVSQKNVPFQSGWEVGQVCEPTLTFQK